VLKKISFFLLFFILTASAQILDDDLDGVENGDDLCPNSALIDIVDLTGCTVEKLKLIPKHHFNISAGYRYSKFDDNTSANAQSFSFGYYYENFSAYFYTSNFNLNSGESGIDDSMLSFYYRIKRDSFTYQGGLGVYIPTYDSVENKSDYFAKAKVSYYLDKFDFSLSLQHTLMRDDFTKDSSRIIFSSGYQFLEKFYTSLSYIDQNSIYEDEKNLQNITLYGNYFFTQNFSLSGDIAIGLNDSASDLALSINLGYYF